MPRGREKQNDHHIRPSSRGGKRRGNIVRLPVDVHDAWHRFFGNLTVEEAHALIDIVMRSGASWSSADLEAARAALMRETRGRRRHPPLAAK